MAAAQPTLNQLADALVAARPPMRPVEYRTALALYRLLAKGAPVSDGRLAAAVGLSEAATREALAAWPGVFRDDNGNIIGFLALSINEVSPHRYRANGVPLFTWCAWDALFMTRLLDSRAEVESIDALTGEPIRLTVSPAGVEHSSHPEARRFTCCDACADDLTQETLLRAFRGLDRFDGRYPRAWLATIVRNGAITRSRQRRHDILHAPDMHAAAATLEPEHVVLDQTLDGRLHTALADLPASLLDVVEAVDIRGLSYREAAVALGVPIGTVMSRLHRARRRLRRALLSDDLASCTPACA